MEISIKSKVILPHHHKAPKAAFSRIEFLALATEIMSLPHEDVSYLRRPMQPNRHVLPA